MRLESTNVRKAIVYAVTALATALAIAFGLSSCIAVRTITTEAKSYQQGDSVVQITTKTVEQYTGKRNP